MKGLKRIVNALLLSLVLALAVPSVFYGADLFSAHAATVSISKTSAVLIKGQTLKLKISGTSSSVKWSSSKKSVATVNSKGKVTAVKKGTATITAKVDGVKYTCKITVENPKISETSVSLEIGKSTTLKITGTSQTIKWSSSDKSVATVSSKGKVKAKAAGTATITAKIGTKKYTCKVTVTSGEVSDISMAALGVVRLKECLKFPSSLSVNKITIGYRTLTSDGVTYDNLKTVVIDYSAMNSLGGYVRKYAVFYIDPTDDAPLDYICHKDLGSGSYLSMSTYSGSNINYLKLSNTYTISIDEVLAKADEYYSANEYTIGRTLL